MLIGVVNSSDAFEITSLRSAYGSEAYDYGGGICDTARIETDVNVSDIEWKKNGNVVGISQNVDSTQASFSISGLTGHLHGNRYTIEAVAWFLDDEETWHDDTQSYDITVYKPISRSIPDGVRDVLFVSAYVEIRKQTYDPALGVMNFGYYVSAAHQGDDKSATLKTEYKASFPDLGIEEKREADRGTITKIRSYFSDSGSLSATLTGGESGQEYGGEAYVRLIVEADEGSDHYHLTNTMQCRHR